MRGVQKASLFIVLYLVQSVPTAFIKTGFQSFLVDIHFDIHLVSSLMGLMLLPWVLKFLWAPWVDRRISASIRNNKRFILLFQLLGAVALLSIAYLDPAHQVRSIIWLLLLFSTISATQDIAIDAMAVRLFTRQEHGRANSIQMGGYYAGEILGGAIIIIVLHYWGWKASFYAFTLFYLIPFIPVLLSKSSEGDRKKYVPSHVTFSSIKEFFRAPGTGLWIWLLIFYTGSGVLSRTLFPSMLKNIDPEYYNPARIGQVVGIYGYLSAFIGAVSGGFIVERMGAERSLFTFGVFKVLGIVFLVLVLNFAPGVIPVYSAICINDLFAGLGSVSLYTIIMDRCRMNSPGTDFTLQASINSIGILIFVVLSGILVKAGASTMAGPYTFMLAMAILAGLVSLWLAWLYIRRKNNAA